MQNSRPIRTPRNICQIVVVWLLKYHFYLAIVPAFYSPLNFFTSKIKEGAIGGNFVNSIVHLVGSGWAKFVNNVITFYMKCQIHTHS